MLCFPLQTPLSQLGFHITIDPTRAVCRVTPALAKPPSGAQRNLCKPDRCHGHSPQPRTLLLGTLLPTSHLHAHQVLFTNSKL